MSVTVPLSAYRHTDAAASLALPATLATDGRPDRVRFTVQMPAGERVWRFPLLVLDEAQTGLSGNHEGCRAVLVNSRVMGITVPSGDGVEAFWLYTSAVDKFRAAALNAELAALTGGVR